MDREHRFWLCVGLMLLVPLGAGIYVGHRGSVRDDELRAKCIEKKGLITREMQCIQACTP